MTPILLSLALVLAAGAAGAALVLWLNRRTGTPVPGGTNHLPRSLVRDRRHGTPPPLPLDTRHSLGAWRQAHRILVQAVELSGEERDSFLAEEYRDDSAMLREVESLLRAHDSTGPLDRLRTQLELPADALAASPGAGPDGDSFARLDGDDSGADLVGGHYALLGKLGQGGMGVVHRARDVRLGRDVALKFLPPDRDAAGVARRRFILEAKAAAALDHPNICTVHEIGETGEGDLFIAMALCEGDTLASRMARGPIHWEDALGIVQQVASGLARAHEAGIVHRDIKPANICITEGGVVKIVDFGIAKVADATLADAGPLLGTLAYMSPEMVRGEVVDHSTDLWSLGVVLYEMLTGTRLFPGDWVKVLSAIRSDDPLPLGRLRGTAPWPVIGLVRRMLSRNREDRPPDAECLDGAIRAAIEAAHDSVDDPEDAGGMLAPGGERRHVTIVESRIVGCAGLMSRLGPDDGDARMLRLQEAAREVVRSHGGVLNEFGNGRMASVFGVPITHEDDVVRAARAAFDLKELVSIDEDGGSEEPLALHTGVASGTVEASATDGGTAPHYILKGDPTVAARNLAAMAGAGEILVSGDDCRVLSGQFVIEPCDELARGTDERVVSVASVVGRSQVQASDISLGSRLTAFTGRERELEKLFAELENAVAGEGRAVTIVAEAGSGKSRLMHEFRRRLHGESVRLTIGCCQAHSSSKPYFPIVEAMRHTLALDRNASGAEARELVMRSIRKMSPDLEAFAPVYLKLLTIDSGEAVTSILPDGQRARGAISEALTAFFTIAASEMPTVLLLEDFHWADEASCQTLRQLCEVSQSYPILIVVTHRPGSDVPWNGAVAGSLIQLTSLRPEDSARMARALLSIGEVPDEVVQVLHERAGGNPFFLEELCRSLLEAGLLREEDGRATLSRSPESLHLPSTVQGIIRSRLDRLSSETREVVRAASVLGRDFTLPLLEQMGPEHYALSRSLATLTSLGIARQVRVVPERAFRFCHVLIQEVAYDTLLPHQRRAMHRQAARAITTVHEQHLDEYASRLARHFSAGEEWFEAARHGYIAARKTLELCEYTQALTTLRAVDEWLERSPAGAERDELQVKVLLEQEELYEVLGERARQGEVLHRLLQLPRVGADKLRLAEVHRRLGDRYTVLREFSKARTALEEALTLTRETGDRTTESAVLRSLGLVGWYTGDPESALPLIDAALAMERERKDFNAIATCLNSRSLILKDMGRAGEALQSIEEAVAILDMTNNDLAGACVLTTAGTLYRTSGNVDQAIHYLERAGSIVDRRNLPVHESFIAAATAHAYLARGDVDMAVEITEKAVTSTRRSGYTDGLARSLCALGELLVGTGREVQALPHLEEAAELSRRTGALHMEGPVRERAATIAERFGATSQAREAWLRCRDVAKQLGDTGALVRAQLGVARNSRRSGPHEFTESEHALRDALRLSREAADRGQELKALNGLGILEWERGGYADALEYYDAALAICHEAGDDINAGVILNSQGVCLRALGRRSEARAALRDALVTSRRSGQRLVEAHALSVLGDIALDENETANARTMFEDSLELRRAINDRKGEGWMQHAIARAAAQAGAVEAAVAALVAAREIALQLDDAELAQACDEMVVLTPSHMES